MSRAMAEHLRLRIEPSKDSFTFVNFSKVKSGGLIKDQEVIIGNFVIPGYFHVMDIPNGWNTYLLLGKTFMDTVGDVCNMQDNKLFLTLVDREIFYDHVQVSRDHTTYIRLGDDPGFIAVSHCGYEHKDYEESLASIDT
ncbi:hypothetical protein YC2023_082079 [Brassica napus]